MIANCRSLLWHSLLGLSIFVEYLNQQVLIQETTGDLSWPGMIFRKIRQLNKNQWVCSYLVLSSGSCGRIDFAQASCGLRSCKNRPAPFPGRMSYKATNPGSICLISQHVFKKLYCCLLGPLFMYRYLRWYVFYLLVVLVRKTSLKKPNRGEGIDRLHRAQAEVCLWFSWFIVLLYCLIVCLSSPRPSIFHTAMARCLCWQCR